jgi:hypothetical protein
VSRDTNCHILCFATSLLQDEELVAGARLEGAALDSALLPAIDPNLMELQVLHKQEEVDRVSFAPTCKSTDAHATCTMGRKTCLDRKHSKLLNSKFLSRLTDVQPAIRRVFAAGGATGPHTLTCIGGATTQGEAVHCTLALVGLLHLYRTSELCWRPAWMPRFHQADELASFIDAIAGRSPAAAHTGSTSAKVPC